MSALRKNKMILHQLDYYTIILSQITHLRSLVAQQMTRPANTQFLNILNILCRYWRCERNVAKGTTKEPTSNIVSPAGLEVPPLGPKWGRWAKKTRVRIRSYSLQSAGMGESDEHPSFFAHLSHLGPSWGDFKASRRNCIVSHKIIRR